MKHSSRQIEERYRRIIEAMSDYIYSVRLVKGRPVETIHGANCAAVTGYTSEEFTADPSLWFRMAAPEDRENVQAHMRHILAGENPGPLEHRIVRKDGAVRWIRNTPVPYRDEQGRLAAYDGIIQDITGYKLAEDKLKASEERFKAQYQGIPMPTFTWRRCGDQFVLEDYNHAAFELTHGQVGQFVGKSSAELYRDRPDIIEDLAQCAVTGQVRRKEIQSHHFLPGRMIIVTHALVPPDLVMVHVEDITERRSAEEELKASEVRFRSLFENAIEGIFRSSLDGRLVLANPALAHMFGYDSPQEAMERVKDISAQIYADTEDRTKIIQRLLKEETITGYEVTFRRADGSLVWVVLNSHLQRDASGNPLYLEGTCVDITERRRSEEELRRSEETFLKAFRSSPAIMSISSIADGCFIEVNERFQQVTGYTREEMIGKTSVELGILDAELRVRMREEIQGRGSLHDWEMPFRTRHGELHHGLMSAEIIDLQGQAYLLLMVHDITERKQAEQALKESEERLQALAGATFEAVFFSENGICFDVNEVATQMTGYSREELIGMKTMDLAAPETRPVMARQIRTKSEETYFGIGQRKDGSRFPVELRGRNTTYRGREVRATAVRDVSERARTEQALKESEEKYRALVENARVAVVKWDMSGTITFINENGLKFFGYTTEELVGSNLVGTIVPETESSGRDLAGMIEVIGRDPESFRDIENENVTRDGRRIWMHWSNKAILDEVGEIVGILSIGSDITARKQAEQELQAWMQRYELIVEASGQVAYDYIVPTGQITWGASLTKVLGLSPEEMNGGFEQWRDLLHPDDRDAILQSLNAAEQACTFWEARYRMRHTDGGHRWIRDRGFFLPGPDGKAYRQLGMMEDITAAQQSEAELNFRAMLLATLQEASIEGILVVDAFGRILSFNRRFTEIWDIPDEALKSRTDERALHVALGKVADADGFIAKVSDYYAHPTASGRDEIILADGRILDRYTAPVREVDGTYYGRVWYFRDVTEEKIAAQAIRQSEEKYRTIFVNAMEGIYQSSPEGCFLSVNPAFARMFGFSSPEELMTETTNIGRTFYVHPEERERIEEILADQEHVENFETEIYRCDGSKRWISINARAVRDEDGDLKYYEGSTFDITERRLAEERLSNAVKRLEDIIEFLPDATFIMDRDKKIIAWNRAVEEMTGVPKEEMLGKDISHGAVPFYGQPRQLLIDLVVEGNQEISAFYQNVESKGAVIQAEVFAPALYHGRGAYVWGVATPLLDSAGQIVGAIESVRDISVAKKAEEALKLSEEKFAKAFNASPVVITLSAMDDGAYLEVNEAFSQRTGYAREEVIGRTVADLELWVDPRDRERFLEKIKTAGRVRNFETRFRMRNDAINDTILSAEVIEFRGRPCLLSYNVDITDRKRTERALKESEEKYRLLAEQSIMGTQIIQDGLVKYVNNATAKITGYSREEMLNWAPYGFSMILHPDDLPDVMEQVGKKQIGDPNIVVQYTWRIVTKTGEIRWVESFSKTISFEGSPADFVMMIDITERKQAEEALRASEELYRLLTENAYDMISRHAPDGTTLYVSPACRRLLGYDPDEIIGYPVKLYVHPDDLGEIREIINQRLKEGAENYTFQHRTLRKDGEWLWIETAGRFIRNTDGTLKEFQCGVRDISERKSALEALQASEEKFRSIVESSPTAMHLYRLDEDGRLVLIGANPAADRTLGIEHALLIGKKIDEAFPEMIGTHLPDLCAKVAAKDLGMQVLENFLQTGKETRAYDVSMFSTGQGMMTVAFTDITARKRAQVELEELDRELKRKNQELESIVYATSHDLRSPLLNIQGFGKRLEIACGELMDIMKAPDAPPEMHAAAAPLIEETIPKALKFIRSSVEKMDSLIKGLLQLSRLGRAVLNLQTVDMASLIHQVTTAMGYQIQEARALVEIGDLPACRCDASQMSQVFSNLIDNALKYRSPERPLRVRIEGEVKDGQSIYSVEDNGVGIPDKHREKIWELFHRLEPGGTVAGEGLGLTVVRRIIERHGGRIWVEEAPEHGSRFRFVIRQDA